MVPQSPASARPRVWGGAVLGQRREQQDAFLSQWLDFERAWLVVLADGMGGHAAGAAASRIATEAFRDEFMRLRQAGFGLDGALRTALQAANARIAGAQRPTPERAGMGTTIVAAHLSEQGLAWISVGDSPLWLFRGRALRRLNEDHSLRSVVDGANAKMGNVLQSALNGAPIPMIDCRADPLPARPGDIVLLASDGILPLGDRYIEQSLRRAPQDPEKIASGLLQAVTARNAPKQDNCSIVALAVPGRSSERSRRRALYMAGAGVLLAGIAAICATLLRFTF